MAASPEPKVLILMGSDSDWEEMKGASEALDELGIAHEISVASAHRTPQRVAELATNAHTRGIGVIIAGAGGAAHLAGVVASHALLPVIGVPLSATTLAGFDALLATAQMPAGIPVATMAVGKPGARNAGLFAARILGLADPAIFKKVEGARDRMREQVEAKDRALQERIREARAGKNKG